MNFINAILVTLCLLLYPVHVYAQDSLASALYQKGHALLEQGNNARALLFLEDATSHDSTLVKAWIDTGHCQINLGKPEEAVKALTKALELNTNDAVAHYYLGEAYSMTSQYPEAIKEYKQAVNFQPDFNDAYFSLGVADIAIGDQNAAQKELLHLQVMDTDNTESITGRGFGTLKNEYIWILQFTHQPGHKYLPVDEAGKMPSFVTFRRKLLQAVKNHDSQFVLSVTDPNISLSGGGFFGKTEFKQDWKVTASDSPFWPVMKRILTGGGGWVRGYEKNTIAFQSPYTEKKFPYALADEKTWGIVTKTNAALRSAPSVSARVEKVLSYDIVIPLFEESVANQNKGNDGWD